MNDDATGPSLIGPYRIVGVLGRGGMGVVYRGEHTQTGASVAVKTLRFRRHGPLASIRREIEALERLSHPGVVSIVGHGVSDGFPWYAMELLRGSTLRDYVAANALRSRTQPETLPIAGTETKRPLEGPADAAPVVQCIPTRVAPRARCLAILQRCCDALSFLHAMGVVHRDLKPENIFVRENGSPVLVDLGLAASFAGQRGREQLYLVGGVLGTVAYMAPEQVRGELVDARADLYALGCILYECLVGEPPFAGVPSFALLDAHLHKAPVRPSALADDVPADLDRLVLKLLEKEPQNRMGYAEDVAAALAPHATPEDSFGGFAQPRKPYLYRPPFVGRDAPIRELHEQAFRAGAPSGRVYIGGESGVGKTRLVLETINHAACHDSFVVLSRCGSVAIGADATSSDRPLHAFAPALLAIVDYCRSDGVDEARRFLRPWVRVLAHYQPALEQLPGYASVPEPAALPPPEARQRVLSALDEALYALAEVRPVVIAIDDLQWADELSLAYLRQRPRISGTLLIVGTYRSEEARDALRDIVTMEGALHLELSRIGREAVGAMVRGMLALDDPPAQLVHFLQRRCDGNPFFVVCYLQAAIGEGLLTRKAGGGWQLDALTELAELEQAVKMPAELAELIDLRLKRLSEGPLTLVQAGAVLGREFDVDLLFACASLTGVDATGMLQLLRERQILEEAGNGGLRFVHDKIRETAYERIPQTAVRDLHRRAAHALEDRRGSAPETSLVLAEHYARAQLHDRAAIHFDRAGDFAAAAHANGDAIQHYRTSIRELKLANGEAQAAATSIRAARVLEKMGDVLSVTGEHPRARECFEDALRFTAVLDRLAPARLERKIGKAWEIHHQYDQALQSYARGAELLNASGVRRDDAWWQEVIQVTTERLWVHYWLNSLAEMDVLLGQSTSMIQQHGTAYQKARFMQLMVMRNIRRERYLVSAETVALARAAVSAGETSSEEEQAALRFVLFFTLYLSGELEQAEREGIAVLSWASRAGASTLRVRTLTYLAATARKQQRLERVRELIAETRSVYEPARSAQKPSGPSVHYPGALLANSCWLAWREHRLEEAEQLGRSALDSWARERVTYAFQWLALFPLLAMAASKGQRAVASDYAVALLTQDQQRLEPPLANAIAQQLSSTGFEPGVILGAARANRYL